MTSLISPCFVVWSQELMDFQEDFDILYLGSCYFSAGLPDGPPRATFRPWSELVTAPSPPRVPSPPLYGTEGTIFKDGEGASGHLLEAGADSCS